jgi:hypothetical protein
MVLEINMYSAGLGFRSLSSSKIGTELKLRIILKGQWTMDIGQNLGHIGALDIGQRTWDIEKWKLDNRQEKG